MTKKITVGVVFGGCSHEHEISLLSAYEVLQALDKDKYNIVPMLVDKTGQWFLADVDSQGQAQLNSVPASLLALPNKHELTPLNSQEKTNMPKLDVIFPVFHGRYGEDGCMQGLFEMAQIPYVGSGVAASAVAMDKVLAKALFQQAGLPVTPYVVAHAGEYEHDAEALLTKVEQTLDFPCFVKPANSGSSIGIHKVKSRDAFAAAMQDALRIDSKILIEQAVDDARELEVALLGNQALMVSGAGEIITSYEFYDYEAKYHDADLKLIIPAEIPDTVLKQMQDYAKRAFRAIDARDLLRVDFLMERASEKLYISEVNTIPGFTQVSMYPKLFAAAGISYTELLDKLIAENLK